MDDPIVVDRPASDARLAPEVATTATLTELVAIGSELQAEEVDLERVLQLVVDKAAALLRADVSWLALYDPATGHLRVHDSHGAHEPDFDDMEVDFGQGLGGAVLAHRHALVIADYPSYEHDTTAFVRDVMTREGITSIMCAPMMRGPKLVGALYVGTREHTHFAAEHGSLLTTLAGQASVAIENGRLYRDLVAKTHLLEETFDIHERLGEAAVSDLGVEGVLRTLARLTGRVLQLEQEHVPPFSLTVGPAPAGEPPAHATDVVASMTPIVMHARQTGRITVYGVAPLSQLEINALDHGATVIALELMKHEAAHAAEWRLRGELLDELLTIEGEPPEAVVVRARRSRVDLAAPHRVLVVEPRSASLGAIERLVRHVAVPHGVSLLAARSAEQLVVAAIGEPDCALRVAQAIHGTTAAAGAVIGISAGGRDFAASLRQAQACVAFARTARDDATIVEYESLGALRFMLDVADPAHARALVRERLEPLAAYDRERGASLLETLRAYLESDGHHPTIAARCHIHPSTVKYRLARIAKLLDVSLHDANTKFELLLALRLLDLFRARGIDLLA